MSYYRVHGVDKFGLIWHGKTNIVFDENCIIEHRPGPYINGIIDNDQLMEFRAKHVKADDWYIPADLDEFHWTPGLRDFHDLIDPVYDYIPSYFYDRVAESGKIENIDTKRGLGEQFPLVVKVTEKICGANPCVHKIAMVRGDIPVCHGHHFSMTGRIARFYMQTHHFKWHGGADFWHWILDTRSTSSVLVAETAPFVEHYRQFGRINIFDTAVDTYYAPNIGV